MMKHPRRALAFLALSVIAQGVSGYSPLQKPRRAANVDRRSAFRPFVAAAVAAASAGAGLASPVLAVGDEGNKPKEFTDVGTQAPAPDGETPFRTLDSGVKVKDFRHGSGDAIAQKGSKVSLQLTGRLLNLNGVIFTTAKRTTILDLGKDYRLHLSLERGRRFLVSKREF